MPIPSVRMPDLILAVGAQSVEDDVSPSSERRCRSWPMPPWGRTRHVGGSSKTVRSSDGARLWPSGVRIPRPPSQLLRWMIDGVARVTGDTEARSSITTGGSEWDVEGSKEGRGADSKGGDWREA